MTNAALHLSEEVLYSPLTTSVINALLSAEKVLAALEADAGPGPVDNVPDQRETHAPPAYKPTDLRPKIIPEPVPEIQETEPNKNIWI